MGQVSRKKFQEALKALKSVCRNDKLPATLRVRGAELIMAIYGVELPNTSPRDRKTVKQLVEERQFEKTIQANVRAKVLEQTVRDAEEDAKVFLARVKKGKV
jgi:stage III sporulation protein SpoIIIAA